MNPIYQSLSDYELQFLIRWMEPSEGWWYREGDIWSFSEFTFDPRGKWPIGRMGSGRGTGFSSGQYAYSSPAPGRYFVPRPSKPFRYSEPPDKLMQAARNLFRVAEGDPDTRPKLAYLTAALLVFGYVLPFGRRELEELEQLAERSADIWNLHKQVHPLTIFLSQLGFNGLEWVGRNQRFGDSGDYGQCKFPPIDETGKVVGLAASSYTYMIIPIEGAAALIETYPEWAEANERNLEGGVPA